MGFLLLGGAYLVLMLLLFLIAVALYVLYSLGLYTLASKRGEQNAFLAWIPVAQFYLLGSMMKEIDLAGNRVTGLNVILPAGLVVMILLSMIPFIGFIFSLALYVAMAYVHYTFFKRIEEPNALVFAIFYPIGMFLARGR